MHSAKSQSSELTPGYEHNCETFCCHLCKPMILLPLKFHSKCRDMTWPKLWYSLHNVISNNVLAFLCLQAIDSVYAVLSRACMVGIVDVLAGAGRGGFGGECPGAPGEGVAATAHARRRAARHGHQVQRKHVVQQARRRQCAR